jgi:ATP-dependent Clp protease ATP-binding subunit ClpA
VRKKFTPEFINRLDKIITFKPLGPEQLGKILDIELR